MIESELLAKISGFWIFHRWHPEVALRYLPIVSQIKKMKNPDLKILEVGSGGLGICPYLKRKITAVDIKFAAPNHELLKKVIASAQNLPFPDSSFDTALSVDMLEHLPGKERIQAIKELIRVTKRKVFIGVPCGKLSQDQDILLNEYFKKIHKKHFEFLQEQVSYQLPVKEEIYDTILLAAKKNKKKIAVEVSGNENLKLHLFLMRGFAQKDFLSQIFFRKILLFFVPIMRLCNGEPTYRKIFTIDIIQ